MVTTLLLFVLLASQIAAHGYIAQVSLDHEVHEGFRNHNPNPHPLAVGWSFSTNDEGPELDIFSPDFVCRQNAQSAAHYGKIAAGGTVDFQWTSADPVRNPNGWAHSGAIITYIANCHGDCAAIDKTELRWNKIQEAGVISSPANSLGIWAADVMRDNLGWTSAIIPASIAPGKYVLRSEIISLHRAHADLFSPEFYPGCINIEVTGQGTDDLKNKGVVASKLYSTEDAQLFGFDFHNRGQETYWPIPGPKLYQDTGRHDEMTGCYAPSTYASRNGTHPTAAASSH